jgi:hypothetical protein
MIKSPAIPSCYLGANYLEDVSSNWYVIANHYIKEAISQIENKLNIMLCEENTLVKVVDHPEEDESPFLDSIMHCKYATMGGNNLLE